MNDALRAMLAILDELGLRYFAVGSVASSIHGVARFTNDVNLLVEIDEGAVDRIGARAEKTFYIDPNGQGVQSAPPCQREQDRYLSAWTR